MERANPPLSMRPEAAFPLYLNTLNFNFPFLHYLLETSPGPSGMILTFLGSISVFESFGLWIMNTGHGM